MKTDGLNARLAAVVTQGDAAWFEVHPDMCVRMRNVVSGEFAEEIGVAPVGMTWRCIVVEAQPGVRLRQPVALPVVVANDSMSDQDLFALFIQAAPPEAKRTIDQLRALKLSGALKPASLAEQP
jgi:hypothetical protein